MERQKLKRRTTYYNKRPAGEERSRGNTAKRQPFVSRRFEGVELEDWIEQSTVESGERYSTSPSRRYQSTMPSPFHHRLNERGIHSAPA